MLAERQALHDRFSLFRAVSRVSSRISLSPYYLKLLCQYGLYVTLTEKE